MSYISSAIGSERLSRVSGYKIKKGFFSNETGNLPQVIAIIGQANAANVASVPEEAKEITSSDEAGRIYGYGSPIHAAMRILRPKTSDGIGGIPTVVIPQKNLVGATQRTVVYDVVGTATKAATHTLVVNGRESVDFQSYNYNIQVGDTPTIIAGKMADACNNVLGSPFLAVATAGSVEFKSKWAGVTANEIDLTINVGDVTGTGVSYAIDSTVAATGNPDLDGLQDYFGEKWYTAVINSYGTFAAASLEQINGIPYTENPTGLYSPTVFKPFMAFMGRSESDIEDLYAFSESGTRPEEVTNVVCPAPNSNAMPVEIAASYVLAFARTMQDTPESDVNGMTLVDIPAPLNGDIGGMKDYNNRDLLVKKGVSTVILDNGAYKIQDLVTTYHPEGESPFIFSYCRNLNLDWNVKDSYGILEDKFLKDRVIVRDNQPTDSRKAIKPKEWKSIIFGLFEDLAVKALINEPDWSKSQTRVEIDPVNPNRFNTFFRYKRTGIARIQSTDVEAGF